MGIFAISQVHMAMRSYSNNPVQWAESMRHYRAGRESQRSVPERNGPLDDIRQN